MAGNTKLTVPCDPDLRAAFQAACSGQDTTAAQAVRSFMRQYIAQHGQSSLGFTASQPARGRKGGGRA